MNNAQQALLWGDDNNYINKSRENYPYICREAAVKYGTDNLALDQLIGLLVECPKETAERLAEIGIRGLINASEKDLLAYKGIGPKGLLRIKGVFSLYKKILDEARLEHPRIHSPKDVANLLMPEMRYLDREHLKVILLTNKNHVIKVVTVSIGGLDHAPGHAREIFKEAIKEGAAAILLVHNHPSGDVTPSQQDKDFTKKLIEASKIININIFDHIIIGDGRISSFKEMDLM
ncbi:MAG: RadC family protein [Desulfitobacteriia bacterium]|jgi:DNA repair protein RadC